MTQSRMNELIEQSNLDIRKFAHLVQLDLLAVAKANIILSNDAHELYKDLEAYVRP